MSNCAKIPLTIHENDIEGGARKILEIIRPDWVTEKSAQIKHKVFTEGISNKLMGFYLESNPDVMVMVRIYGAKTELLIDRNAELGTMMFLQRLGAGPEVFATFENGIAYEFIPGRILTVESCRSPHIYSLVAAEMAKLHSFLNNNMDQNPFIWAKLWSFYDLGVEAMSKDPKLCSKLESFGIDRDWGRSAIKELEGLIKPQIMPIGFCHNDLLLGNIIYDEKRGKVSFIDFEYAATNYIPFDIANHFAEFAGVEAPDFSKCPNEAFKRDWIQQYLDHYCAIGDAKYSLDQFAFWVDLNMPLAHLFWILWSVFQAANSTIDFDFAEYAHIRLNEFEKLMKPFRNMSTMPCINNSEIN